MKNRSILLAVAAVAGLGAFGTCTAGTKSLTLPPDLAQLKASPLPGYARAQSACVGCHSAEYMLFQPPGAARPYWNTMVVRMKTVFKAPLDDADIPAIVDYLARTYGAEQAK